MEEVLPYIAWSAARFHRLLEVILHQTLDGLRFVKEEDVAFRMLPLKTVAHRSLQIHATTHPQVHDRIGE